MSDYLVPIEQELIERSEVPDLWDLIRRLPKRDVEMLAILSIRAHRRLMERAEQQFNELPEDYKSGKFRGGELHFSYLEAEAEMLMQAATISTLVDLLGYIPKVGDERERVRLEGQA